VCALLGRRVFQEARWRSRTTLPYDGITRIRFEGFLSPRAAGVSIVREDPCVESPTLIQVWDNFKLTLISGISPQHEQ
jgi:hypothetical protein